MMWVSYSDQFVELDAHCSIVLVKDDNPESFAQQMRKKSQDT